MDQPTPMPSSSTNTNNFFIVGIILALVIGGGGGWWYRDRFTTPKVADSVQKSEVAISSTRGRFHVNDYPFAFSYPIKSAVWLGVEHGYEYTTGLPLDESGSGPIVRERGGASNAAFLVIKG